VTNINGLMIVATGPSIVVSPPPPTLAFTASPTSGVISLAVNFSSPGVDDENNAITNWSWTFGDGATSAAQSPSHTYTASGNFNPTLTAVNANGSVIVATGPSIPVYPAMIASTANPVVGAVPLTVKFAAATVDLAGNPITGWHWVFGDGTTSAAQSPSHIYTNEGAFSPTLMATNSIGTAVAGYGPASITATNVAAYSGLVQNGGFETGDFTGWTLASAASNTLNTFVDNGSQSEIVPHSGKNLAASGSLGSLSYLSQTLATSKGAPYLLSLWLNSPDGQSPNQFLVSWNGTTLFNETNVPTTGWTNLQFLVSATGTGTVLKFGFRNDPSYLGLDDVSVVPAQTGIGSFNVSGANLVLNGTNGLAGQTYYVMMSTNLALPLSQWTAVATNVLSAGGNFSITVTNTVIPSVPHRFYVLQTQ
jgi:PKD repeat protein